MAVSDRASLAGPLTLTSWIAGLAAAGVAGMTALQLREKDLDDRALYELARAARSLWPAAAAAATAGCLLINGRLDIALATGADGAHLPADGVPVAELRRRFGPVPLLGVSTHRIEEVAAAREAGADYVTFGPVYATPGKERYGPPAGLGALARAAAVGIPVLALGGVTLERLGEVAAAGAVGAAGIRLFQDLARLPALAETATRVFSRPLPPPASGDTPRREP